MLKYKGGGFIAGVPARNLTDEEVKTYGKKRLLDSGLYEETRERKPRKINDEPEIPQAEE